MTKRSISIHCSREKEAAVDDAPARSLSPRPAVAHDRLNRLWLEQLAKDLKLQSRWGDKDDVLACGRDKKRSMQCHAPGKRRRQDERLGGRNLEMTLASRRRMKPLLSLFMLAERAWPSSASVRLQPGARDFICRVVLKQISIKFALSKGGNTHNWLLINLFEVLITSEEAWIDKVGLLCPKVLSAPT